MTDHLTEARACLSRVDQAATHFSAASWLTATCEHILDHLEAQQTEASLRRGLADITAGRTVDLGSFAQPATDPPAAQQGDSGHRDGDEAARPKLNAQTAPSIPTDLTASQGETGHEDQYETDFDRWLSGIGPGQREQITRDIEAARDLIDRERHPELCDCTERVARAAIAAAEPHIRAEIADEIEQHYLGADFGRNPTTGADSPDASLHDAYDEALNLAARIARQEQP